MHIKRIEIHELFGRSESIVLDLQPDLNIITGKNGAGKTSILKLVWYVISGNIYQALKEVDFRRVTVFTTEYTITVVRVTQHTCRVEYTDGSATWMFEDERDEDGDISSNAEDEANSRVRPIGSSVFLPTFRRIEGGFTLDEKRSSTFSLLGSEREKSPIETELQALSTKLSWRDHIFVAAISTADIATLLLRQYADLSESTNALQQHTSQKIFDIISEYEDEPTLLDTTTSANEVINTIKKMIGEVAQQRADIMTPIEGVRELAQKLLRKKGIKFGPRMSFGDTANAVNSNTLSAGEKQMLSFICYNTFYQNAVFFIDEPELSLHVDWQRQLMAILMDQQASNQFIIATHSPFIYNKYPDKEILVDDTRGDSLD